MDSDNGTAYACQLTCDRYKHMKDFESGEDAGPLVNLFENRALRTALLEAALAAPRADVRMQTRALSVECGTHGVVARLDSGEAGAGEMDIESRF